MSSVLLSKSCQKIKKLIIFNQFFENIKDYYEKRIPSPLMRLVFYIRIDLNKQSKAYLLFVITKVDL